MARFDTFTFRVSREEKRMIAHLADSLKRSRSDAMRLLVREAMASLERTYDNENGSKNVARKD